MKIHKTPFSLFHKKSPGVIPGRTMSLYLSFLNQEQYLG
jgi:hypothetical protein